MDYSGAQKGSESKSAQCQMPDSENDKDDDYNNSDDGDDWRDDTDDDDDQPIFPHLFYPGFYT